MELLGILMSAFPSEGTHLAPNENTEQKPKAKNKIH